jgi:hypothetical protein
MNSLTTLSPIQLRKAADIQERILKLQDELQEILGAPAETPALPLAEPKKRKKMSAAGRARIAAAARARWAALRGEKTTKQEPAQVKRHMSAASRAAIAAAAKARWAKVKASGKRSL